MGTIIERKRATKGIRYTAQVRIKRGGKVVHRENKTYSTRQAAQSWIDKREKSLAKPGGLEAAMRQPPEAEQATLAQAIDKHVGDAVEEHGKTKAQVLRTIRDTMDISQKPCHSITSHVLVDFGKELHETRDASTVGNYFSHLSKVFQHAQIAWGYPLDFRAFQQAVAYLKEQRIITKSREKTRRLEGDEADRLMEHWVAQRGWAAHAVPMHRIMPFAIMSTRRLSEICRMTWRDFDFYLARQEILIRKMKDPNIRKKIVNDVRVHLLPEAIAIIEAMPRVDERIFPYNPETISDGFGDGVELLGMDPEVTFHTLRHEGISRLFDMGKSIQQVAYVSGHKSTASLNRYTHMTRLDGKDIYENWKWMEVATAPWGTYERDVKVSPIPRQSESPRPQPKSIRPHVISN